MSEQEIEIKEAYITSQSYPILWIGENGFNITRYGKLLLLKPGYYKDEEEELYLIVPTIDFEATDFIFKPNRLYIVAGGVSPNLLLIKEIIKVYREEDIEKIISDVLDFPNAKYELASGIKRKTYGIIYEQVSSDAFEPLQLKYKEEVIIAKNYPDTFKIYKRNDKLLLEYIPPKDC